MQAGAQHVCEHCQWNDREGHHQDPGQRLGGAADPVQDDGDRCEDRCGAAGKNRRQAASEGRARKDPTPCEDTGESKRAAGDDDPLYPVDRVGDSGIGPHEEEIVRWYFGVPEQEPQKLERNQGDDEGREEQPIAARFEPSVWEREEEQDKEENPCSGHPDADREEERRGRVLKERSHEDSETGVDHEPPESGLRTPPRRDQAARDERPGDDHVEDGIEGEAADALVAGDENEEPDAADRADSGHRQPPSVCQPARHDTRRGKV